MEGKPNGLNFYFCKINEISSIDLVKGLMQETQVKNCIIDAGTL